MKKTIIALYGRKDEGKSETLKCVCKLLLTNFPNSKSTPESINYHNDILVIIDTGFVKIGIESQGDPKSRLICKDTVKKLANQNCDIIVCATRTHGETVCKVDKIANENDYYTLWLSSFWSPQSPANALDRNVLNRIAAESIIEVVKSLIKEQL